jgi:hypothetical protein
MSVFLSVARPVAASVSVACSSGFCHAHFSGRLSSIIFFIANKYVTLNASVAVYVVHVLIFKAYFLQEQISS